MAIKRGALLLITLFLASASLSLGYTKSQKDLTEELDQCLDRCQRLRWSTEEVISCQGRCAHDYFKEKQQQEESENEVGELELNASTGECTVEECQGKCVETYPAGVTQFKCKQYCERKYGPEMEEEWDMDLAILSDKKQYKKEKCEQECEKSKAYKQPKCIQKCEKKFGEKEQEVEENTQFSCERECQREPRRQQGQCLRRCRREPEMSRSKWERYESCQRRCSDLGVLQQVPCETRCATEFGFRGRD